MKKLFTLLTLACAFLVANAQVTTQATLVGANGDCIIEDNTAKITKDGVTYLTLTKSDQGFYNNGGSAHTVVMDGESYTAIRFTGASGNTGEFTVTYGETVSDVVMYIMCNSSSSNQNFNLNGTRYQSQIPAYSSDGEFLSVPLNNNDKLSFGNVRFDIYFIITYEKTLPLTISDFSAIPNEITYNSCDINVTYTASNVSDDANFILYYKDAADADGEYTSIPASLTGGTVSLANLESETSYTYDIYLEVNGEKVNNAETSVNFTTLDGPTVAWGINYAEIAADNLPWGTTVNNYNASTNNVNYTYRDTETRFNIGGTGSGYNSNYQFYVQYGEETIVPKNNVTTNSTLTFRYQNTTSIGLYAGTGSNQYGILDLKKGDIVEVAMRSGSDGSSSLDNTVNPENLINLELSSSDDTYNFTYVADSSTGVSRTLVYKIFKYNVTADGNAAFTVSNTYLAYVKVTPAESVNNDVTLSPGEDDTMQSGVFNAETNSITMHSQEKQVTVFISCPEGAIPWYAVEAEKTGVNSPDFQPGNPSEMVRQRRVSTDLSYEEAKKYDDPEHPNYANNGQYYVTLENETTGTLYIKYSYNDQEPTDQTPATFNFTVVKTDPTGVETIVVGEGETIYFDLSGRRVVNPEKGIFIKVEAGKVSKVIL